MESRGGPESYSVVDGHHRLEAARRRGLQLVPVLNLRAMSRGERSAHGRAIQRYRRAIGHPLGRRTVYLSTDEKVKRLWTATHALYEDDPEHFTGGCADISVALFYAAARAGWTGVKVEAGWAEAREDCDYCVQQGEPPGVRPCWNCEGDPAGCECCTDGTEPCPDCGGSGVREIGDGWHVWLRVDGVIFDPTWGRRMDTSRVVYHPEATGRDALYLSVQRHGVELEDPDTRMYSISVAVPHL